MKECKELKKKKMFEIRTKIKFWVNKIKLKISLETDFIFLCCFYFLVYNNFVLPILPKLQNLSQGKVSV